MKQLSANAGSLDLRISEDGNSNWRNGPVKVGLSELSPGDTVSDTEYLKNVGQTDGACLGMSISNVRSDEGQSVYNDADVYNPEAETDRQHSNDGELDDQVKVKGTVTDVATGEVLASFPYVPFHYARQGMITTLGDNGVILEKNGGNKLKMDVYFEFPHRDDNNDAMKDSLTFDLDMRLYQKCNVVDTGTGFVKLPQQANQNAGYGTGGESFNGNGTKTAFARARFGDSGGSQTWEVAIGNDDNVDDQGQYGWPSGQSVPFEFEYSGFGTDEATFTLDGTTVSTTLDNNLNGRIGIQGKANEATVMVENAKLFLKGPREIVSNIDLTASNDGTGRAIEYLVANTNAGDLADGFTISGDVTVTLQNDFPGGEEDVALDVVLE